MEIKVTKENIKNGTPDSSEKCAVALALKETLGSEYTVGVFPYRDKYQDDEDSTDCYYFAIDKNGKTINNEIVSNDEKVNEFINEFDNIELTANPEFNKLELKPFEFDVELHE